MQLNPRSGEFILVTASGAILLLCYHWIFSAYFPTENGTAGHDYAYFLPALLDGYYWQLNNGPLTPEWFTPAFCGGLPAFASPINLYYSLPQWLTYFIDPLTASYLTLLVFAALGFTGFYLLLRIGFKTAIATALLGGALFMFNGFFSHRIVIGHLTYHAFMLTPLIAFLLLPKGDQTKYFDLKTLMRLSIATLLLGYMIYSGMIHLILPVILILIFIGTLHGLMYGNVHRFWLNMVIAGGLSIILALPKLAPSIMYVSNFERTDYLLPGAGSLWDLLRLVFDILFFQPSPSTTELLTNVQWPPARHEFEYGITFIPLLVMIVSTALLIKNFSGIKTCIKAQNTSTWLQLGVLAFVLSIPMALNIYTPDWNALLKETPILKDSSSLVRWFSAFIPIFILIAMILLEKTSHVKRFLPYISAIAIISVVMINFNVERSYYTNQSYKTDTIVDGYAEAKKTNHAQVINKLTMFRDQHGKPAIPPYRNNTLVQGASQLLCYEPLFGYRLEHFPRGTLIPGEASWVKDGYFNLKNPACYVFGDANNCKPGDHFSVQQVEQAKAFVSYQPFVFSIPGWLSVANWTAICLLLAILLLWMAYPIMVYIERKTLNQANIKD